MAKIEDRTKDGTTFTEVPVNTILNRAKNAGLTRVLVIGVDDEGKMYAAASHSADAAVKDLERFQKRFLGLS